MIERRTNMHFVDKEMPSEFSKQSRNGKDKGKDENLLSFDESADMTNSIGSEDYLPDTDGSFNDHVKHINGDYESPSNLRRGSKKRKNVPN